MVDFRTVSCLNRPPPKAANSAVCRSAWQFFPTNSPTRNPDEPIFFSPMIIKHFCGGHAMRNPPPSKRATRLVNIEPFVCHQLSCGSLDSNHAWKTGLFCEVRRAWGRWKKQARLIRSIESMSSTTKAKKRGIGKATTKGEGTNSGGITWAMTIRAKTDKQAE